jgi:enoyl-[acyl-carrier-protein] reductase (NADH)
MKDIGMETERLVTIIIGPSSEEGGLLQEGFQREGKKVLTVDYSGKSTDTEAVKRKLYKIGKKGNKIEHILFLPPKNSGKTFKKMNEKDWDKTFSCVKTDVFAIQEALPYMISGGTIVFIASVSFYYVFPEYGFVYDLAMGTIHGMVASLAEVLGEKNIRVNAIALADKVTNYGGSIEDNKVQKNFFEAIFPLKSDGAISLLDTVLFLCSEDAGYISGNTMLLDKGNLLAHRSYAAK